MTNSIKKFGFIFMLVITAGFFFGFKAEKAHAVDPSLEINVRASLSDLPLASAGAKVLCKTGSGGFVDSGRTASAGIGGYCQVTYTPTNTYQLKLEKSGYKTYISSSFFLSQADYNNLSRGISTNSKSYDLPGEIVLQRGTGTIQDTTHTGSTGTPGGTGGTTDSATSGAPKTMFGLQPIYKVLQPPFAAGSLGEVIARIWQIMMNAVNSLVLLVLVYVAFMNILRIKIDSYAVKKILPTFIMAVIMANFSFLICRIIIDVGNVAVSLFLLGDTHNKVSSAFDGLIKAPPKAPETITTVEGSSYSGYIFAYIIKQVLLIVAAGLMFILSFIFLVRNYFLYFLVAISPVAFMAMIIPNTSKYFQQWWSNMIKWVFMPVVSVFWLWLAGQFMQVVGVGGSEGGTWLLPLGFAGLCLYMAITSPFKMDKAIVGGWTGFAKKAGKFGSNQVGGVGARTSMIGQSIQKRYKDPNSRMNKFGGFLNKTGGVINVPATAKALKTSRANFYANMGKAEVKTPAYNRFAGRNARIDAAVAKTEDDLKFATPESNIADIMKIENAFWDAAMDPANQSRQAQNLKSALSKRFNPTNDPTFNLQTYMATNRSKARQAIRNALATDNPNNIMEAYGGMNGLIGPKEEDAVLAQGHARNFDKLLKGTRTRDELGTLYYGETGIILRNVNIPGVTSGPGVVSPGPTPAPAVGAPPPSVTGEPPQTPQQVIAQHDPELTEVMREMLTTFKGMEERAGGEGSLGGSEGFDQILAKISEIKPEMQLDSAGLAAAILPDRIKVEVAKYGPETLAQLTMQAQKTASITSKVEANLQAHNLGVLRSIHQAIESGQDLTTTETKIGEGKKALE